MWYVFLFLMILLVPCIALYIGLSIPLRPEPYIRHTRKAHNFKIDDVMMTAWEPEGGHAPKTQVNSANYSAWTHPDTGPKTESGEPFTY